MQEEENIEEYVENAGFEFKEKGNWKGKFWDFINGKYFIPIVIIFVAIIAFSLGRISGLQEKREPVKVINNLSSSSLGNTNPVKAIGEVKGATDSSGQVVASKSGTKYHYPWCAGAKQISEKNKIIFNSTEEARAAGYTPASNCKGLK